MATRSDYNINLAKAAEAVLLEITGVLGAYRQDIVVIGGLTPTLVLREATEPHVGSVDVDLLINHRTVDENGYERIRELLIQRGYEESRLPFRFIRQVTIDDAIYQVPIDFLAGVYDGTSPSHRHQEAGGIKLRKVRGGDMVLQHPLEIEIQGILPDGGKDSATCRVVQPVLFLILKAHALRDRRKEKDAYDLYYLIRHYPGGNDKLVEDLDPYIHEDVVTEAINILARKFESPEHVGPKYVADFEEIQDREDREIIQRDVYERVAALLKRLDAAMY